MIQWRVLRIGILGWIPLVICAALFQNCDNAFVARSDPFGISGSSAESSVSPIGGNEGQSSVPSIPEIANWNDDFPAGEVVDDCLTNVNYNICLIYKNPVFSRGASYNPALSPDNSDPVKEELIMTYGLKVPVDGPLQNKHYNLTVSTDAEADSDGNWKFSYKGDRNHFVAQINTFYWLNRQITYLKERTGKFYFSNKAAPITVYNGTVENNAYFDGNGIVLGYIRLNGASSKGDIALDTSVTAHEAGHANLYAATRGARVGACATKDGCLGGIHEGLGDVHAFILFPETSVLGEYFFNSQGGLRNPAEIKQKNLTAQDLFSARRGEVHDMGEVYASIWWEVWKKHKDAGTHQDIETIFTEHMGTLGASDTFTTALGSVKTLVKTIFPTKEATIVADFEIEYTRLGITLP